MSPDNSNNGDGKETLTLTGARPKVKDKSGIKALRRKLRRAYVSAQKSQSQVHLQKSRTAQIIAAWRARLAEAEEAMLRQRRSHDQEMKSVLSKLLFFEGQLRKEQKQILELLHTKDEHILDQKQTIDRLKLENTDLKDRAENDKTVKSTEQRELHNSITKVAIENENLPPHSRFERSNQRSKINSPTTRRFRRGRSKSELDLHLLEKLDEVSDSDEEIGNGRIIHNDEHGNAGMHTRTPGSLNRITSYSDENLHQHADKQTPVLETENIDCGAMNLQEKYDELLRNVAGHFIETPISERSRKNVKDSDIFAEIMEELQKEYGCAELEELRDTVGELNSQSLSSNTDTLRWPDS